MSLWNFEVDKLKIPKTFQPSTINQENYFEKIVDLFKVKLFGNFNDAYL